MQNLGHGIPISGLDHRLGDQPVDGVPVQLLGAYHGVVPKQVSELPVEV